MSKHSNPMKAFNDSLKTLIKGGSSSPTKGKVMVGKAKKKKKKGM